MFAKLGRMYGTTFANLWGGIPLPELKAEWQSSLAAYTGPQIAWALGAVGRECDVAPTLPRFARYCAQAPRPEAPVAPTETAPISPAVKEKIEKAVAKKSDSLDQRAGWAVKVLSRIAHGEIMPMICETNAIEALTNLDARHLAPAEYVALNKSVWLKKMEKSRI
ncbi:MAG: hypothetical protein IPM06_17930 [Rhizobiales bacterium]|nr:hypothetical protein [Hyphomicrobiales bacterium]